MREELLTSLSSVLDTNDTSLGRSLATSEVSSSEKLSGLTPDRESGEGDVGEGDDTGEGELVGGARGEGGAVWVRGVSGGCSVVGGPLSRPNSFTLNNKM